MADIGSLPELIERVWGEGADRTNGEKVRLSGVVALENRGRLERWSSGNPKYWLVRPPTAAI